MFSIASEPPASDLPVVIMRKALVVTLIPLVMASCTGRDDESAAVPESRTATGTVTIVTPTPAMSITGSSVTVQLSSTVQILPAGDLTPATGHHHIYLDADLTAEGVPVPSVPGSIVHMGDGSSTYTFEDVPPGAHRLIVVIADGVHVPLQPWVVDTVTFTVN